MNISKFNQQSINEYSDYEALNMMSFSIINYLVENNEDIWKLLKYNDNDALSPSNPNLSKSEKGSLIYSGQPDASLYRVFMQPATDSAFEKQSTQLRVYPDIIIPHNRINGTVTMTFEIVSHADLNSLSNYGTRIVWIIQQLIKTFNGKNIKGVGNLAFDKQGCPYDSAKQNLYNRKNYFGYTLMMSTHI